MAVEQRMVLAIPWIIPITLADVADGALGTTVPSTPIGPYNFVWTRIALKVSVANGVFVVMLRDEADSKNFMSVAMRTDLIVPADSLMVDIPRPWVFKAHTTIYLEGTNGSGQQATLWVALHGYLEQ